MLIKFIHKFEESILSILLVVMTILVFSEVIARFVFNHGISWAQELTLITNSWMVLLGASYCIREKAHIGVEFLVDKLEGKAAKVASITALVACLFYAAIFLYGSVIYVWEDYQIDIGLDDLTIPVWFISLSEKMGLIFEDEYIPTWVPASVLVISFTLIGLRFLHAFYQVLMHNNIHVLQHIGEVEESMELADSMKENL